jgi:hypothetical protein
LAQRERDDVCAYAGVVEACEYGVGAVADLSVGALALELAGEVREQLGEA